MGQGQSIFGSNPNELEVKSNDSNPTELDQIQLETFERLKSMGFDQYLSLEASQKYKGNVDKAVEYATNNNKAMDNHNNVYHRLQSMGFDQKLSLEASRIFDQDLDKAIQYISNQGINSKSTNDDTNVYNKLISMGFDENLCFEASQRFNKNLDKAVEYITNKNKITNIHQTFYENDKSNNNDTNVYNKLLSMGFDENLCFEASQRFNENLDKAVEYVTNKNKSVEYININEMISNDMNELGRFKAFMNGDCKGDKIKLPESVSQRLLSMQNITYPLCFQLSVPVLREEILNSMQFGLTKPNRKIINCGVLDFTAGDGCVCLPKWIMDNIQISDGDTLSVSNITLPKGTFVRLQPHTLLKDMQTKQKLESSLRSFTTLTANSTITIESMNHLKLNILKVKPNKNHLNAIQIIDTDLVVEFEEALDGKTRDNEHYERDLCLEESVNDVVVKGQCKFYKLRLSQTETVGKTIKIIATPNNKKHDVDLFASWSHYEPGTTNNNYDYHCVDTGKVQIVININDNTKKNNILYIGVHGFDNETKEDYKVDDKEIIDYILTITEVTLDDIEFKELFRASSLKAHDEKQQNNEIDPNKQFCSNCHRFVNKWSFDRHYQHCIKQFWFCDSCKKPIKMEEKEIHNNTLHSYLKCKICFKMICGGKQTLLTHQKYECLKRPIECKYCHLSFPYIDHTEHENICGSRTEICIYCNQRIALSLIQQHTMNVHSAKYEEPIGIAASIKSDDSIQTHYNPPNRNYDKMFNDNNNNNNTYI